MSDQITENKKNVSRSWVWNHAEKTSKDEATCNLCLKKFARPNGGTSALRSHLKTKHQLTEETNPLADIADAKNQGQLIDIFLVAMSHTNINISFSSKHCKQKNGSQYIYLATTDSKITVSGGNQ